MHLLCLVLPVGDDVAEGLPAEQACDGGRSVVVGRAVAVLRLLVLLRRAVEHRVHVRREVKLAHLARRRRVGHRLRLWYCKSESAWEDFSGVEWE